MSDADTLTEQTYPQPIAVEVAEFDKQLAKLDKKTYTPEYLALLNHNDKKVAIRQFAELKEAKKLTPSSEVPEDGREDYIANPIAVTDEDGEVTIESATPELEVASSGDYIANPIAIEDEDGEVTIQSATDPEVSDDEEEESEDSSEAEDEEDAAVVDEFSDELSDVTKSK